VCVVYRPCDWSFDGACCNVSSFVGCRIKSQTLLRCATHTPGIHSHTHGTHYISVTDVLCLSASASAVAPASAIWLLRRLQPQFMSHVTRTPHLEREYAHTAVGDKHNLFRHTLASHHVISMRLCKIRHALVNHSWCGDRISMLGCKSACAHACMSVV
jgi:hypothetical protein